ncbi:MAG: ankyrin repeat domain-containing protein [Sutterellaceae bacterium]|nr:ankyrin repeat domain-containing protein [Sutterellaceae bacterium]
MLKFVKTPLFLMSAAAIGLLSGCASAPATQDADLVLNTGVPVVASADAPVKMAGPEENWANFAGAIDRDRADVVSYMLQQGVSPNTIVKNGDPALVRAIRMDSERVIRVLLDAPGLDIDTASEYGETALMLAAFKGNITLLNELLAKGATVNRVGGWTPLHYAATEGHDAIVEILLEKGARVNVQTSAGVTPLYMAARKPSRKVVMQLLKAGAYRDLCNDKNQSPADAAAKAGDAELAKYLAIEKCVKPTVSLIPSAKSPKN